MPLRNGYSCTGKRARKSSFWLACHSHTFGNSDGKEQQPKVDNLFLDCGARNKKEVEGVGIHVGNAVTYADGFDEVSYGNFIARAFDNRIGGFMIAEVARLLKGK